MKSIYYLSYLFLFILIYSNFNQVFYRPDKCHLMDKRACVGDLQAYKTDENNIILLSKDFHNLFDGLNADFPSLLIAFKSKTEDVNRETGRYEVELFIEFYDTSISKIYANRLKEGSQKFSDLVWGTKVWVTNVNDFKYCLDWKMQTTVDYWKNSGKDELNYLKI